MVVCGGLQTLLTKRSSLEMLVKVIIQILLSRGPGNCWVYYITQPNLSSVLPADGSTPPYLYDGKI